MTDDQLVAETVAIAVAANDPSGTLPLSQVHLLRAIALTREQVHRQTLAQQSEERLRQNVATATSIALGVIRAVFIL